jgi:ATP-dependent helicase/DNAse subunit B
MAIHLILGPSASGKTQRCIERVREEESAHRFTPIWVVVPDRLQAIAFRRRLSQGGGVIGVQVGTFGDLYQEILRSAGRLVPVTSEPVIHRLIQASLDQVLTEGELGAYEPLIGMPGFHEVLRKAFAELKRAQVWPEHLLEFAQAHPAELRSLAKVYSAYQVHLQKIGWGDPEGVNWLAREALEEDSDLASAWALLVFDGFDSFNSAQRTALKLLSERVREIWITLSGTPEMDRLPYRRFAQTLRALQADFELSLEVLPAGDRLPPALAHLERGLFREEVEPQSGQGNLGRIEARSPAEEAREALRWIKARLLRDNFKMHECAVVVPDPDRYRSFLQEAAGEYQLRLRFIHGEPLTSAPGIVALLDLLALPLQGFPRRLMLEAVRTPYFDWESYGLHHKDAAMLEAASIFGQVIEGVGQWDEVLGLLAARTVALAAEDEEGYRLSFLPGGGEAGRLREGINALAERLELPDPQTMTAWVRWLEDLLDDLAFFERNETNRDEASHHRLRQCLRALVIGEKIAGKKRLTAARFVAILERTLKTTSYQEHVPPHEPAVQVLQMLEARGVRFRAVALLGLSEGLFPEIEREDPFLKEPIRKALKLEPRLGREQAGLFYQAVTRADHCLLLTRPYLAEDGERWEPSPYWHAVSRLFTEQPEKVRPETPRPLAEAGSPEEFLFWAVRRKGLPARYQPFFLESWRCLQHAGDVLQARRALLPHGPYEGSVGQVAGERFRGGYVWSPSRLESYGTCPHRFYVETGLDLEAKEPPEPGFDARQLGLMLHAILEETYQAAEKPDDLKAVLAILEVVAEKEFRRAPAAYGFRPNALWEVEKEQMLAMLRETVEGLYALEEGWTPTEFEKEFGLDGDPALVLKGEGADLHVRGVIDRVDRDAQGKLRVIDYKAGSSHLSKADLIEGRRLQLPLYALAAEQALKLGETADGLYWAISRAQPGGLRLSSFRYHKAGQNYQGPRGAMALAQEHVMRIVAGVQEGEFAPSPPRGGCPSYCAAAAWCWRYQPSAW